MVEVVEHSTSLANRLNSVDSGVSDLDETDGLSSSWSSAVCDPLTEEDPEFASMSTRGPLCQDSVETTAIELARDVVCHLTRPAKSKPVNRHAKTVLRMVDELSTKHEILFASLVKKLDLSDRDLDCKFLENVADRMFSDKQFNWGRIVTLYAFAGRLARHCVEKRKHPEWPERIAAKMGKYIAENMSQWIISQGGWDAMDEFFKEQDNLESKIWKGLLLTVLGLGALATTVAVVR